MHELIVGFVMRWSTCRLATEVANWHLPCTLTFRELMTEEDSIQDTVMPATTMTQMAVFPTTAYQSNFLAQFEAEHPGLFNK